MTEAIRELIRLEPVRVRAVIGAIIALALTLGVDLHGDTVLEAVDALLPILAAGITFLSARGKVTPTAKLEGDASER